MTRPPTDVAASVRARLLRLAQERGVDFQLLMTRYANERLLYRLAQSRHKSRFVLKGAALFTIWTDKQLRTTRDLDLLGSGDISESGVREVFSEVLALETGNDGVAFDTRLLGVELIRENQEYGGVRLIVNAHIKSAKVRLQVDIAVGDTITPAPTEVVFPALLDFPPPRLLAYPPETVVAEKLEAIVQLGLANTRMKDFYDLVILSRIFEFDGDLLVRAIRATFERRKTPFPSGLPVGLSQAFATDAAKVTQWTAFARRTEASDIDSLASAIAELANFAASPLAFAAYAGNWGSLWPKGGPWSE